MLNNHHSVVSKKSVQILQRRQRVAPARIIRRVSENYVELHFALHQPRDSSPDFERQDKRISGLLTNRPGSRLDALNENRSLSSPFQCFESDMACSGEKVKKLAAFDFFAEYAEQSKKHTPRSRPTVFQRHQLLQSAQKESGMRRLSCQVSIKIPRLLAQCEYRISARTRHHSSKSQADKHRHS